MRRIIPVTILERMLERETNWDAFERFMDGMMTERENAEPFEEGGM